MDTDTEPLLSRNPARLVRSLEAEDVNRLRPENYKKFVGELRKLQKLMAEKKNVKKESAVGPSHGAIRKSYAPPAALNDKSGKKMNIVQPRMTSTGARRSQNNALQPRASPTNHSESRSKQPESLGPHYLSSSSLATRKTSSQKPIALRRGNSGENFPGARVDVNNRSCVSSPGACSQDVNCMDGGSPASNCGCDCDNAKRLHRLLDEHEKLQMEHARVLREYRPSLSSDPSIAAVPDREPSELAECYRKEVLRLKDELLAVKRQREEDLKCYDLKEVDLEQQIAQLIQILEKKEEELANNMKRIAEIMAEDFERKENCEFLNEEVNSLQESLREAEEKKKNIQQAYFASEEECTTLKNVAIRLTKVNSVVGKVARDTSAAILKTNKRLQHLISHFRRPGDIKADPGPVQIENGEMYDGDLNLKDFPIASQLKELEDNVIKLGDAMQKTLEEQVEKDSITKKERFAMWLVLKELHLTGCNGLLNGGGEDEILTNGTKENGEQVVRNGDHFEELSAWAMEYFAKRKDRLGGDGIKSCYPDKNVDSFVPESEHLAITLGLQAEIVKLKAELSASDASLKNVVSKYTTRGNILSTNCQGAQDEIHQLDSLIDEVLKVLLNIPVVVEKSTDLKCLWAKLTASEYPNGKQ